MSNPIGGLSVELNKFDDVFKEILKSSSSNFDSTCKDADNRLIECLKYNLLGGKKNRGLFLVKCFRELNPSTPNDQLEKVRLLGWCIELFQSYFLIHDDIIDHSTTRRGKVCWYKKDNVGLVAINDANYLQNLNFQILKNYFGHSKFYLDLLELFLEMYRRTVIGQCFDMISNPPGKTQIDFSLFTMERYKKIIAYKTAYYSFSLPIRAALYMTGIRKIEIHKRVEDIMLMIGQLFQIQDDFLDLYGDHHITGKIGTDIIEGKCTWLVTMALSIANQDQLTIIKTNYGRKEPESVAQIEKVFQDLRLKQIFFNLEENSFRQMNKMIFDLAKDTKLPASAFSFCLNAIYKRKK